MALFKFLKNSKDHKNIIYVLDRLHDFTVRDWTNKNIDYNLYKILNSPEVYQEAIHMGLYPIIRDNKEASSEFIDFIDNLWMYIEYDVNTDFLWAKIASNSNMQKSVHEKISGKRKEILRYLLNKKLISNEQYSNELNHQIKSLA